LRCLQRFGQQLRQRNVSSSRVFELKVGRFLANMGSGIGSRYLSCAIKCQTGKHEQQRRDCRKDPAHGLSAISLRLADGKSQSEDHQHDRQDAQQQIEPGESPLAGKLGNEGRSAQREGENKNKRPCPQKPVSLPHAFTTFHDAAVHPFRIGGSRQCDLRVRGAEQAGGAINYRQP